MFYRFSVVISLLFCATSSFADVDSTHNAQPNSMVRFTDHGNFIQQRALGPIKLQSGLPEAASRLTSSSELQFSFAHNNVFMGGGVNSERLILDGESSQLNIRYRQRLNSCWQLNASGALLAHSSGWFDRPLDDWHQFFGMPDAQRGESPSNRLEYAYESGSEQQILTRNTSGLGDAQLQVQRSWGCVRDAAIVRFGVKIPLGEPSQFNGNGGVDAFVDLQSPWMRSRRYSRMQWAASIGLLGVGQNKAIAKTQPVVAFGVAGMNVAFTHQSQLLAQLDWHTPIYQSQLRELGKTSVQLSLGWRYQTRSGGAWELSFSEDATVDTVPDIVVRLAWVLRFGNTLRFK